MKYEDLPHLDFWMLNTIVDALQKEYDRYKKASGINQQLALTAKNKGLPFAMECEKEINENRFHPLGQIWQAKRRVEEIREAYSLNQLSKP